ncbi:ABC transporter substrate-binding protein [Aeromicrobium sp. YIM 150415]|uniref:ABC transporter substrate-binding protein n=1 Tax=Aeromicrobium sp. YIM 150415 TaxID=2803912 RepID=UPI001964EC80|nr:ABC transporter substrate-binding protein [Aeromicrobium sp. YIM 150415]MBM9462428.1 ABC transporter substrate-binding protein [Aeromicrobium sp. YIM 150415]
MPKSFRSLRRLHRPVVVLGAVALAMTAAACGGEAADTSASSSDELTVVIGTGVPTVSAAPYIAVPQRLFWEEQGLDVKVEYVQGGVASNQLILAGRADIGLNGMSGSLAAATKSEDVRVAGVTPGNLYNITVPGDSSYQSIKDLKGAKIGVPEIGTADYLYARAIVRASGLDPDTDVTWVPVGAADQGASALKSLDVVAYGAHDGTTGLIGTKLDDGLRILPSPIADLPGTGTWTVSKKALEDKPDLVEKFLTAQFSGALFTETNPKAAIEIFWDANPDQKPADDVYDSTLETTAQAVDRFWTTGFAVSRYPEYGYISDEEVDELIKFHEDAGLVEGNILDPENLFQLEYAREAIARVDRPAVEKLAHDFTLDD